MMKGDLLPKYLRRKGKSKYLFCRLKEEKMKSINQLYEKYNSDQSSIKHYSLWEKIVELYNKLFMIICPTKK